MTTTKKPRNSSYTYRTKNNLKHHIAIRRAVKVAEKGGIQVLLRDIEEDLANYCQVTRDTILMIKRGINQPSLAVALKIAQYCRHPVEEIFFLVEND